MFLNKTKIATMVAVGALLTLPAAQAQERQAVNAVNGVAAAVTGTAANATGTGTFTGRFIINSFAVQNGKLMALGTLVGTTNINNTVTNVISAAAAAVDPTGACPILHLVVGPINLNLLGLTVSTNQIVLDITAQAGPGNLLGNLLCSVANLLNGGPTAALANLLNQVLAALAALGL